MASGKVRGAKCHPIHSPTKSGGFPASLPLAGAKLAIPQETQAAAGHPLPLAGLVGLT